VATAAPDRVVRIDLGTLKRTWSVDLEAAPTAVAAIPAGAVVATANDLSLATKKGAARFAEARLAVNALAASDEGTIVYAAEHDLIEAFDADGTLARTIRLDEESGLAALAPVPRASSIAGGAGGRGPSALGTGTGNVDGRGGPKPKPPATDTAADVVASLPVNDALLPAVGVAAIILVICRIVILIAARRHPELR
jgi:hypothetical protein